MSEQDLLSTDAEYLQRWTNFYERFVCGRVSLGETQRNLEALNEEFKDVVSKHVLRGFSPGSQYPSGLGYRYYDDEDEVDRNLDEVWMQSQYC